MQFSRDNLHHAYIVEGGEGAIGAIKEFLKDAFAISLIGNPDFIERSYDSLGIEDARWLKEEMQLRAVSGNNRFYIIRARTITVPAQNALLKTLEEPTSGTHIFIVIPRTDVLLPTLLSRVEMRTFQETRDDEVEVFLGASKAERLEIVAGILKDDSSIDPAGFVQGLERYVYGIWKEGKEEELKKALQEIVMVERYIYDQSAQARFLLEHLALVLPRL